MKAQKRNKGGRLFSKAVRVLWSLWGLAVLALAVSAARAGAADHVLGILTEWL